MKERPILFKGEMVRAIMSGQKTMTRRVVNPSKRENVLPYRPTSIVAHPDGTYEGVTDACSAGRVFKCPYGQPGDRLWVRETFGSKVRIIGGGAGNFTTYRATDPEAVYCTTASGGVIPIKWKPSIHMPRWACRIVLEIVSVRVERLQGISEADAKAEGACYFHDIPLATPTANPNRWSMESPENTDQCLSSPRWAFANYFCKVSAKRCHDFSPWDANPWVWVVEFKKVAA